MESGPHAFGKSSLVMTLLTNFGVTDFLCSFTLVLKGNTGKGFIKIRVPRKVFSQQYYFIRCRIEHLQAVEYKKYSRFTFVENTIHQKSREPSFWEVIHSFVLLPFASFVASRTLLQ